MSEEDALPAGEFLGRLRLSVEPQRRALEALGLSPDQVERAMQPFLSFLLSCEEEQAAAEHWRLDRMVPDEPPIYPLAVCRPEEER